MDQPEQSTIIKDPGSVRIKRALISVANKTGIDELATALIKHNVELIATQGTCDYLKSKDFPCEEISDFTGMPELMEGRVKTLHPKIHGGILAQRDKNAHQYALKSHDIKQIDLVIVNLYPFVDVIAESDDEEKCLDNIDIGGLAMIRSAAKNYKHVAVLTAPKDYQMVLKDLDIHDGAVTQSVRKRLAANAFSLTATYDANISSWFMASSTDGDFPSRYSLSGTLENVLRYGENPQQQAALYNSGNKAPGIVNAKQIQGQALSYNNILDAEAAYKIVSSFDLPSAAIVKHTNPCGVACGASALEAYNNALIYDPQSAYGGCVALNVPLDLETARKIMNIYTEIIVAPSFESDAVDFLSSHEKLSVIATGEMSRDAAKGMLVRSLSGGFLVQKSDDVFITADEVEIVTERGPTEREMEDLIFAFNVCKFVSSNAIVYAKNKQTLGIGGGQTSRIDAARIAAEKAQNISSTLELEHSILKNSVVASDGFFPFADSLIAAADAGVTAIIQPGGSIRDEEVITAADDRAIAMVFTKIRHFRH